MARRRVYIVYDMSVTDGLGPGGSVTIDECDSEEEAKAYRDRLGPIACYSYASKDGGAILSDERLEWSWPPARPAVEVSDA